MPAKSKAQFRFMKMMEHNPDKAKKDAPGLSSKEAAEYTESNTGKKAYSKLPEEKENKDHFAPHLNHPQMKSSYPGDKITGEMNMKKK